MTCLVWPESWSKSHHLSEPVFSSAKWKQMMTKTTEVMLSRARRGTGTQLTLSHTFSLFPGAGRFSRFSFSVPTTLSWALATLSEVSRFVS